jgi:tRNA(fMet)-specific endonuclease VapC
VVLILDTNALSAIAGGDPEAVSAASGVARLMIPVIVLGEYRFAVAQSRHRAEYDRWLTQLAQASIILNVDSDTSIRYAQIRIALKRAGSSIPSNDIWIAALCRQHSFPILSRDRHFDLIGGLKRDTW